MTSAIIEFSARNRLLVFILVGVGCIAGYWSARRMPLDAIPDLSDTQVIIYCRWDRSPDVVEDQVAYPIVTALLGAPRVRAVRAFTDFGYSFIYVIFQDGTDMYWARSRVQEYLASVLPDLPAGVRTQLGPDATGWVYQYALEDTTGKHSLGDLRSLQDWYIRYHLNAVPGVAEVASIGGFGRQYQVNLDPNRLQTYRISIQRVVDAVRASNSETGGRLLEFGETEYMVRGRGYARSIADIADTVLAIDANGAPVRIRDVGRVVLGPELRRGVADLDGRGDVVSGIVVMRQGQNALDVIDRVKAKLDQIAPGLPSGVRVVPVYDRSQLIRSAIANLRSTLVEVMVTVALVVFIFLRHFPSAIIPIITIPVAVLISFIPFRLMGVTANIMSLGGIAIAIGALVDASIVVVEQVHKRLEQWHRDGRREGYREVVIGAVKEVGGPSFFALLVIAVSFLPVLTLEALEGRLFRPLAYTKNLAMLVAAVLAITLDPALRLMFTRVTPFGFRPRVVCRAVNAAVVGTIQPEERHLISRGLIRLYGPVAAWTLKWGWVVIGAVLILMAASIPAYRALGSEFMPPLDEGSLLYMPSTMPGISIGEAQRVLQITDRVIRQFPEVDRVLGKAGRADTATDPAPLSMLETVVTLKPKPQWRRVPTWYSSWAPEWAKRFFRHITPDTISREELVSQLNAALQLPGISNAWTMPVKARIDMLTTGIRTPIGLKVQGADPGEVQRIGEGAEALLRAVRGTRSVFAERSGGGYFLDFRWNRAELARYGLTVGDAEVAVSSAIGGDSVTTVVEGRQRYPVNVRYMRDFRSDLDAVARVLVPVDGGRAHVPLSRLSSISIATGPSMIRDEDGLVTGYVYVDVAGRDPASYIREADALLRGRMKLPAGYALAWSGQYEAMQRVRERLVVVVPITLFLIFLLLYLNTRSFTKTAITALAVPFSAIGAIWLLHFLGYSMSIAVWVGLIALLGVDAETGVFMLLYLDLAYERARREGRLRSRQELRQAVLAGAVRRIRPKFMTVATTLIGLVPIMWSTGTGSDVMKRIAAPLIGGIVTSFLMELLVYPVVYEAWKWHFEVKSCLRTPSPSSEPKPREIALP